MRALGVEEDSRSFVFDAVRWYEHRLSKIRVVQAPFAVVTRGNPPDQEVLAIMPTISGDRVSIARMHARPIAYVPDNPLAGQAPARPPQG